MFQHFRIRFFFCLFTTIALLYAATLAQGAIDQWVLDDQGKKTQSTTVCNGGANLTAGPNANLSNSDLTKGYLSIYDLTNTSFSGSTLTNASFDYSQLAGTVNSNISLLSGTVFNNATIDGASFNYATSHGFTEPQLQSTASYKNQDLSGINLTGNTLKDWAFPGQDLTSASFNSSMLGGADLTGANLTKASFESAALINAKFDNANISGANFNSTTGAPNGIFKSGFTQAQLQSTVSYRNNDLSGIQLQKNTLNGWDFHGQNLTGASFVSASLSRADFTQATLTNASFNSAVLSGAIFTDAAISGANFNYATAGGFTQAQLQSTKSYKTDKNLTGIKLAGNDLTNWDFHGQDLTGASFYSDTLYNAATSATSMAQADLTNFSLGSAALKGAIFTDALVSGANFNFTASRGFTQAQLQSTKSYRDKDLSKIQLAANNLTNWDFHGQNLTSASFASADLTGADLSQATLTSASFASANLSGAMFANSDINSANFSNATGFTEAQLQSTTNYQNKSLLGVQFKGDNFSGWDLREQNLTSVSFDSADLRNANLSKAILLNTSFAGADLTGANFANADIRGTVDNTSGTIFPTSFFFTPTFTQAQLQSTSSYQQHDLKFVRLAMNNLSGWDFHDQSLLFATFAGSNLTGAVFADADVRGADLSDSIGFTQAQLQSTKSYKTDKNLSGIKLAGNDLTNWDFNGQNLATADFDFSKLTRMNFSNATILGANFSNTTDKGFTLSQLQSTKSYKTDKDLSGIQLGGNNLTRWDFQGQNLESASFVHTTRNAIYASTLTGANFAQANLANASFSVTLTNGAAVNASLNSADFTAADTRGSVGINFTGTTTVNTIRPDGTIQGLDLSGGQTLVVRNYTSNSSSSPQIPINVQTSMNMGTSGILQMVFDDKAWNSTISFDSGIPVTLGGKLQLTFKSGVDVTKLVGESFDLFNWTGVNRNGTFNVDFGGYTWDVNRLYTDGTVIFEGQTPGHFYDTAGGDAGSGLADGGSGSSPTNDLTPVPEPYTFTLLVSGLLSLFAWKFRSGKRMASVQG